ncbi:uncharacterized protein LOC117640276 [Thrips palmi]|uniref:Uncharacterized protein LOC117640276 n=1 Tax=Thrips palmi TaxID=161013 RepID=A0A6P8YF58_THRPL|nr:uncharacterized protein LOC117640276 [Thrips palmi]
MAACPIHFFVVLAARDAPRPLSCVRHLVNNLVSTRSEREVTNIIAARMATEAAIFIPTNFVACHPAFEACIEVCGRCVRAGQVTSAAVLVFMSGRAAFPCV